MTKDKAVTMSRELIEHLAAYASDSASAVMRARAVEVRKILAAPVVERQEPVAFEAGGTLFKTWMGARNYAGSLPIKPLYAEQTAPVAVMHPFADKVIRKLQRFQECADDGQGADIGRHWIDLLTQLGLLNRVQRSPALWDITQQGEDCLDKIKELNQ